MKTPCTTIGVITGGQLGRMLLLAVQSRGIRGIAYDPDPDSPAMQVADKVFSAPLTDHEQLIAFAQSCNVVIPEFENVPRDVTELLAQHTTLAVPPDLFFAVQNRIREKELLTRLTIPQAPYAILTAEGAGAMEHLSFPVIVKTADGGYDGKGQALCTSITEARRAAQRFATACVAEERVDLAYEFSIIIARTAQCVTFLPPARNTHVGGILATSVLPGAIPDALRVQAEQWAQRIADTHNIQGVITLECFVTTSGTLLANEVAPRVHNSGHWSIEGATHSQFDLAVLCALTPESLPQPTLTHPACGMVNLLGHEAFEQGISKIKSYQDIHIHVYGKKENRTGRKMGHVTYCGSSTESVEEKLKEISQVFYGKE